MIDLDKLEGVYSKGVSCYNSCNYEDAIKFFNEVIEEIDSVAGARDFVPLYYRCLYNVGTTYLKLKDNVTSKKKLLECVNLISNNEEGLLDDSIRRNYMNSCFNLGCLCLQKGDASRDENKEAYKWLKLYVSVLREDEEDKQAIFNLNILEEKIFNKIP